MATSGCPGLGHMSTSSLSWRVGDSPGEKSTVVTPNGDCVEGRWKPEALSMVLPLRTPWAKDPQVLRPEM